MGVDSQDDAERPPKKRRLSDGSRARLGENRPTNGSLDESLSPETDGEDPLTLATPRAAPICVADEGMGYADEEEEEEEAEEEEEDERPKEAAPTGKARRVAVSADKDSGPEPAEEEEGDEEDEEEDSDRGVELVETVDAPAPPAGVCAPQGHGSRQGEEQPQVAKGKGRRSIPDVDSGPEPPEEEEEYEDEDYDEGVEIVDSPAPSAGEGAPPGHGSHHEWQEVVDPPLPVPTPTYNQQQEAEDEKGPGQVGEGGENERVLAWFSGPMHVGAGGGAAAAAAAAAAASPGENREVVTTPAEVTDNGSSGDKRESESKRKEKRNDETRPGVVLKIYVENSMCHRKLSVPLCKHVNFINGRNGSGKSAILAALQICLGAKAHLTHRSKSMAGFIRHGWKGDAVVEVTLLNNKHGFKFEEYGASITVRRTIKQPSGGGFELRGHDGKVKSRDRAELFRMLDELNIQVDNPVAVLDQENSKKFLQGSETEKYSFFMKVTELGRIKQYIDDTKEATKKMRAGHSSASERKKRLEFESIGLQKDRDTFKRLAELAREIYNIKEQRVWALVGGCEGVVAGLAESVRKQGAFLNALDEKIAGLQERIDGQAAATNEINDRFEAQVAEVERLKKVVVEKNQELSEATEPLTRLRSARSSLQAEGRNKTGEKKRLSDELLEAREEAKMSAASDREKALHDEIQKTNNALEETGELLRRRGGPETILELRGDVYKANEIAQKTKEDFEGSQRDLAARKEELRNLDTVRFDPLSNLGQHMPGLVREIRKCSSKFSRPPLGPVGISVQLKEEFKQFSVCIEGHLARNLSSFVVANQGDKAKLMTIMSTYRGGGGWQMPMIIIQTPQPRYRPPQNPPGYLQIMQAIDITDDQVFNALVDQGSIEKSCLFASKDEAEKACLRGQSGSYQRMPHGMYEAYYPSQGGKNCNKFTISDGNLQTRMNTINVSKHKRVLGVNEDVQKEEAQRRVREAEVTLQQQQAVADQAARDLNAAEAALEQEEDARDELQDQARKLGDEESRLSVELRTLQATQNDTADPTIELEAALQAATQELSHVEQELAENADAIRRVADAVEPKMRAFEDADKDHKRAADAADKTRQKVEAEVENARKLQNKVYKAKGKADEARDELKRLEGKKNNAEEAAKDAVNKANMAMRNYRKQQCKPWDGMRVNDPKKRKPDALEALLVTKEKKYKREIDRNKLGGKTEAEVMAQLATAKAARNDLASLLDKLDGNIEMLSAECKKRAKKWMGFLKFITGRVSREFILILQKKGASGRAEFDVKDKTLHLFVQKDVSDDVSDVSECRDVRQLSGGEKSYTTLAILLALGAYHESPFRAMDEFDVFMDADARDHAVRAILKFGEETNVSQQFILITPQDLSSVTPSKTCKVIKMKPPRKRDHNNQATLDEIHSGGT